MKRLLFCLFWLLSINLGAQTPFIRELRVNDQGAAVKVNALLQDAVGYIWLGTEEGLFRFNGRAFTHIVDPVRQPVTALCTYGSNIVIGYANGSLGTLTDTGIIPFVIRNYRPASAITSLHSKQPGMLWATTESDGLFLISSGCGIQLTSEEGLTDNFLYDLQLQPDEVMVCTDRGINHVRWHNGKPYVEVFNTTHGLPWDPLESTCRHASLSIL